MIGSNVTGKKENSLNLVFGNFWLNPFRLVALGYASDSSNPSTIAAIGVLGGVVALSAWGAANTLPKVFGFAILYGFNSQICSCWGNAAKDVAGKSRYSTCLLS
jgi:hypothetical protein